MRNASELIESCGQEHALKLEAVRVMREANKTAVEIVRAFEDAWVLEDPEWAEAAGGREALVKKVIAKVDEEGRIANLDLERRPIKSVPASISKLRGLKELNMQYCGALTSADLRATPITSIGMAAFYGCASLSAIQLPAGLTSIGSYAFQGCSSLSAIELPAGLTSIGEKAFKGCSSLSVVEVPARTELAEGAFDSSVEVRRASG